MHATTRTNKGYTKPGTSYLRFMHRGKYWYDLYGLLIAFVVTFPFK